MTDAARSELTEPSVLRVAINMGNMLLVTGQEDDGMPSGTAPEMATRLARKLGVDVRLIPFPFPGEIADAMPSDSWDVALIAIEPKRAEQIAFSNPYVEIEATYIVPEDSPIQTVEEVDQPGIRIAVANRAAYDLYLTRTLQNATLHRAVGLQGAHDLYVSDKLDALAGLKPALKRNIEDVPGSRMLPGRYTSVRQAIGTKPENTSLQAFIEDFVQDSIQSGLVGSLLDKYGVADKLKVAGQ